MYSYIRVSPDIGVYTDLGAYPDIWIYHEIGGYPDIWVYPDIRSSPMWGIPSRPIFLEPEYCTYQTAYDLHTKI